MDYAVFCKTIGKRIPPLDAICTNKPYCYPPLGPNIRSIRLSCLYPGSFGEPIRCSFFEVPFQAAPPYTAVSYTWGDPAKVSCVWVNGSKIHITASLDLVLGRLRNTTTFQIIWVDGICINQEDDVEKGKQVQLMRDIYAKASSTFIYLGEEWDGSVKLPFILKKIRNATRECGIWKPGVPEFEPLDGRGIQPERYKSLGLPPHNHPDWEIVRAFFRRPWFRRVWVIQEAVMSRSATVYCGGWNMSFTGLLQSLVVAIVSHMPIAESLDSSEDIAITLSWLISVLLRSRDEGHSWTLIDILHRCRIASATDKRDHVYGLLGLSDEVENGILRPRYKESLTETYSRYAGYFVNAGDGIKVLYNASSTIEGMPSWVPNWADKSVPRFRLCPEPDSRVRVSFPYSAGIAHPTVVYRDVKNPDILHVRGLFLDILGKVASQGNVEDALGAEKEMTVIHLVQKSANKVQYLLHAAKRSRYLTEDIETTTWRTLIANRKTGLDHAAGPEYAEYFRAFKLTSRLFEGRLQDEPLTLEDLEDANEVIRRANTFLKSAMKLCRIKLLGITEEGLPGQFPLKAQCGDLVMIPCGSAIPFVIRPCSKSPSRYRLVGECYVHGVMEGQAFEENEASIQDFELI